jgi:hypothetical protein
MNSYRFADKAFNTLFDLIEQRFDLRIPTNSVDHLQQVCKHYMNKRKMIIWEQGEARALTNKDYAKAVLISEAVRLLLREIDPWPRRKKSKRK